MLRAGGDAHEEAGAMGQTERTFAPFRRGDETVPQPVRSNSPSRCAIVAPYPGRGGG